MSLITRNFPNFEGKCNFGNTKHFFDGFGTKEVTTQKRRQD